MRNVARRGEGGGEKMLQSKEENFQIISLLVPIERKGKEVKRQSERKEPSRVFTFYIGIP